MTINAKAREHGNKDKDKHSNEYKGEYKDDK